MEGNHTFAALVRACLVVILLTVGVSAVGAQSGGEGEAGMLRNPLNTRGGADPWLTYYDGYYFLATTTWASEWQMRRSPTLAGLKTAEPQRIYFETEPSRCCNFWAPEFHLLDGPDGPRWYFYYTAGSPTGNYDNQRSYVLESAGTDPLGPYTFKGRLMEPGRGDWMIDGSVMTLNGQLYYLYSAFGPRQSVYIAPMSNPWTLSAPGVLITEPEYSWESFGSFVNEGPVALQRDDRTFLIFSASSCATGEYKLGMLTYHGGDPLDPSSWEKHPEPVFSPSPENGVYGPGHNGFFKSPDGTEEWIVYHAVDFPEGACNGQRTTRVQRVNWNADGTPDFGVPVSTDEVIAAPSGDTGSDPLHMSSDPLPEMAAPPYSRFQTRGYAGAYLRHANFVMRTDFEVTPLGDSLFIVQPGLADPEAVSIESVNFPGFYLRHRDNAVILGPDDGSADYPAQATWWIRPGLADPEWISFEAYDRPGYFIGRQFGVTALVAITDDTPATAREDATFLEER